MRLEKSKEPTIRIQPLGMIPGVVFCMAEGQNHETKIHVLIKLSASASNIYTQGHELYRGNQTKTS